MVENITQSIPQAQHCVREVWIRCQRGGPHRASDTGRCVHGHRQSAKHVHAVPQPQECTGAEWYEEVNWTYGDYWEELYYITYE